MNIIYACIVFPVLQNITFVHGSEGAVFFESETRMSKDDCLEYCSDFPGFRLAQPKTKATLNDARQCN